MSEETIKGSDGNVYDVTDVTDDKTDIVIIKKNGKIVEEQITQADKVRILYNINHRWGRSAERILQTVTKFHSKWYMFLLLKFTVLKSFILFSLKLKYSSLRYRWP